MIEASGLKQIEANGLRFAYYEQGTGPLVLCVHGFPDTADAWLPDVVPALAEHGFRAVAPFTRGYAPTSIPVDGSYSALDLGADLIALIEALGEREAVLIGHDWGALAVHAACGLDPSRVRRLITVAIPHPRAIKLGLRGLWRARHFISFQLRGRALRWLTRDNFSGVDAIYRRWSPNWDVTEEELGPVKRSLSQPGVPEAVLGYYWSFRHDQRGERAKRVRGVTGRHVEVPTLTFAGEADGAIVIDQFEKAARYFDASYELVKLPRVGHFPHREAPDQFVEKMLAFLGSP